MGFLKNSTCLVRFIADPVPKDIDYKAVFAETLTKLAFRAIDENSDTECSIGWVELANYEDIPTKEQSFRGEYLAASMRVDSKKVPASAVKPIYRKLLSERKQQDPKEKITKEIRQELRTLAKESLLRKAIPFSRAYDMVWDLRNGAVWFSAGGDEVVNHFVTLFKNTFELKLTRLFPYNLALYLSSHSDTVAANLKRESKDSVTLLDEKEFLGRDFLTWLWYKSEALAGQFPVDGNTVEVWPGNRIVLSSETNEEQVACKGENSEWSEAKRALAQGKKACAFNFKASYKDMDFAFTLDSRKFNLKGLKTPKADPAKAEELEGLFFEKVFMYQEILGILDRLFVQFLEVHLTQWPSEWAAVQKWIEESQENGN